MNQSQNTKLIQYGVAIVLVVAVIFLVFRNKSAENNQNNVPAESTQSKALSLLENDFDFGDILINGGIVSHIFVVQNKNAEPVKIKNISTSCMCTTAVLRLENGVKKGPFGMVGHKGVEYYADVEILPGKKILVEAIFDPLAHGPDAVGKVIREIYLETNSEIDPVLTLKFRGNVVKELPKAEGPSFYITKRDYDFGAVKQSAGIVNTGFEVVNNGTEDVVIEFLPTSCACTSAQIENNLIKPGEKGIITVSFDPNLHPEPEGKFFKTVEVISNVDPNPELKIYMEMDYDLGMEKLKNQKHDD